MSKQLVRAGTSPDPYGWRAGTVRVLANALLVLLAAVIARLRARFEGRSPEDRGAAQPPARTVVAPP